MNLLIDERGAMTAYHSADFDIFLKTNDMEANLHLTRNFIDAQ